MNIEILQEHINAFTREVVDSGFKRDLDDYISSFPAAQKNITAPLNSPVRHIKG